MALVWLKLDAIWVLERRCMTSCAVGNRNGRHAAVGLATGSLGAAYKFQGNEEPEHVLLSPGVPFLRWRWARGLLGLGCSEINEGGAPCMAAWCAHLGAWCGPGANRMDSGGPVHRAPPAVVASPACVAPGARAEHVLPPRVGRAACCLRVPVLCCAPGSRGL